MNAPVWFLANLTPPAADRAFVTSELPQLAELFGVSAVAIEATDAPGAEPLAAAEQAPGKRCERCWRYTETAADLCDRCAHVLGRR